MSRKNVSYIASCLFPTIITLTKTLIISSASIILPTLQLWPYLSWLSVYWHSLITAWLQPFLPSFPLFLKHISCFPTFLLLLMLFQAIHILFVLICFLSTNSNFLSYWKSVFSTPARRLVSIIWTHSSYPFFIYFYFIISYCMIFFVLLHSVLKTGTLKTRQVLKIKN